MVMPTLLQGSAMCPLFAIFDLGPGSLVIIGVIAVLLFGERLPEVARSVGKWFMEFKKEVRGFETDIRGAIDAADSPPSVAEYEVPEDRDEATAPKFEPPSST